GLNACATRDGRQLRAHSAAAHFLAGGADDRLDELMISVLVAAIHELAEAVAALRQGIVAAAEVERADRVVTGMDREDPYAGSCRRRVADDGCFAGEEVLAEAAADVEARRGQRVRPGQLRRG